MPLQRQVILLMKIKAANMVMTVLLHVSVEAHKSTIIAAENSVIHQPLAPYPELALSPALTFFLLFAIF